MSPTILPGARLAALLQPLHRPAVTLAAACAGAAIGPTPVHAQQQVSLPEARAWIDVATFHNPMGGLPAGGGIGAVMGSLLGRGEAQQNAFGLTQGGFGMGRSGRFVDVTLMLRRGPLAEATMNVPSGFLSPALKLAAPSRAPAQPVPDSDDEVLPAPETERPKGRMLLYWGCGSTIRAGQPRVIDFAAVGANPQEIARLMQSRRATQRGAHSQPGRPLWPSPPDLRMVPASASLLGEHSFSGIGVPDGFRFQIPAAQDLMPALVLQQRDVGGATELSWNAAPTARAYFASAMGGAGDGDMIIWTSSELPDLGFGLLDYQTNAAIDGWLREKVVLPPGTTSCAIPKGVFPQGAGGVVNLIGYGSELNLAHPPRPADRTVRWEPVWAAKVRVKTVTFGMLGVGEGAGPGTAAQGGGEPAPAAAEPPMPKLPGAVDLLRGVLGR